MVLNRKKKSASDGNSRGMVDLTRIENPCEQADEILDALAYCQLDGFGGKCGAAAHAINDVLFHGQGAIIMAYNTAMMRRHQDFVGHVAVKYRKRIWDTSGQITLEQLRSWGMLDPEDLDYAERYGKGWNEREAYRVTVRQAAPGASVSLGQQDAYWEFRERLEDALRLKAEDEPDGKKASIIL